MKNKESKEQRDARKKAMARQWVLICLEQGGYTKLIPNEERITSADYLGKRKTFKMDPKTKV